MQQPSGHEQNADQIAYWNGPSGQRWADRHAAQESLRGPIAEVLIDRATPRAGARGRASQWIYPLSLAIYCTSWTFFGSVGFATRTSIDFLAIYVGPIVMIGLCTPLLRRVIALAKSQNITSIADFIAARYGKSQAVAATVALIAIVGSVP